MFFRSAFADHGTLGSPVSAGGGTAERTLFEIRQAGIDIDIDIDSLGAELQKQGAEAFEKSWADLLADIRQKSGALARSA